MCVNVDQILYNTLIEKGIIYDQVWKINNKNKIPRTKTEFDKVNKESNDDEYCEKLTWENMEFNLAYDESRDDEEKKYLINKMTEQEAYDKYKRFKEDAGKDLSKILDKLKSPLIYYKKLDKSQPIPVVVAATFAAVADLKKYGNLSPNKMIAISEDDADETINKYLLHPGTKRYEESDYFIMMVVANLKYFFNLTTKPNERNFKESPEFNYKISIDKNHYLIEKRKESAVDSMKERPEIDLDANAVEMAIENFKERYLAMVNEKRDNERKIRELVNAAEEMLQRYSYDIYMNSMHKINKFVQSSGMHNEDNVRMIALLDFTEEPFKNTHEILGKRSSDKFYMQRLKVKKDDSEYSRVYAAIIKELENVKKKADQEFEDLLKQSIKSI